MIGHDDDKRKTLHATVCAMSAEALRAFCISHGTTVTAFLDGLGHALEAHTTASMDQMLDEAPSLACALKLARQIDADRRSREPRLERPGNNGGS